MPVEIVEMLTFTYIVNQSELKDMYAKQTPTNPDTWVEIPGAPNGPALRVAVQKQESEPGAEPHYSCTVKVDNPYNQFLQPNVQYAVSGNEVQELSLNPTV